MKKNTKKNIAFLLKYDVCRCLADMISFQQIAMQRTNFCSSRDVEKSRSNHQTKKSEQNRVVLHSYREHSLFKRPSTA